MNRPDANCLETAWTIDPGVRFRRMFDEAVLIHQERAETLVLNDSGISFLELCDGERTVAEIAQLLSEDFEAPAETLGADLVAFAEELQREGVLRDAKAESV